MTGCGRCRKSRQGCRIGCPEGKIDEQGTCKEYLQVRQEGTREVRPSVRHYKAWTGASPSATGSARNEARSSGAGGPVVA